uniref:Tripartite motif-containing protein 16-like n=1 Tax=Oryzias latipes TaxID=8090 RepID=A0A3B3HFX1_ORYLA
MAQQVFLDKEKLICSICFDLQKDPVTIPCGHSYCLECIQNFWIGEEPKAPSCPQCRQNFTSRPKLKAAMSCLTCMVSYSTLKLQENICIRHDEVIKIFCRTDQKCICSLCSMDEHKGHDMVSAAAERAERQTNQNLFKGLICLLEQKCSEVEQKVTSYQREEVRKVEELQEKMQHEITKLKKTEAELDQLSSTEDHLHFLNNYSSLSDLSICTDLPSFEQAQHCFDDALKAVSETREKLEETLRDQTTKILDIVDVFLPEDFRSREDFMKYYHQITLDPNTANRNLSLSEQNRTATWTKLEQNYSSHPDRFAKRSQVLSAEGLTGRCYWEVDWSGVVYIAVAYKDRSGTGTWDESAFGFNDKSWALKCSPTEYTFYHKSSCVSIAAPRSSRVGVYLNHKAGTLSFYSISDSMTLLHKVQTTFTQPLHAGFWISKSGGMIRLLK